MRTTDPVHSASFHLRTAAEPAAVWRALTCPVRSPSYLHGLAVHASWTAGAPVLLRPAAGPALRGQVLHVDPDRRLSLTIEDASGACTYLTWSLRRCADATVLRLQVEEPGSTEDELEDVWLPVLERLGTLLRGELPAG